VIDLNQFCQFTCEIIGRLSNCGQFQSRRQNNLGMKILPTNHQSVSATCRFASFGTACMASR
jgi:hypothetical protein